MLNKKLKKGILIFTLLAMVFFVLPTDVFLVDGFGVQEAVAQEATVESKGSIIAGFLAWVTLYIASAFGTMLTLVMIVVNYLFTLQEFDIDGVAYGWRIVRDLCNMFFILVLLMIAFATILRLENYSMKKYLPKLLIMAVLINFSKTICLFLIDISQIVMLTFSNAFAGASSNFVTMLHVNELLELSKVADFGDMTSQMFYAAILALVFMTISLFIMIMMMGILIMRLIMFWVLIVLAPLAFLSTAVPGGGKYWSQWWGEFTKYLIVGPVLAFFTWLSLTIAKDAYNFLDKGDFKDIQASITEIGKGENAMQLILAIGLLVGAMKITMSIGAMGASFGANLASKAKMKGLAFGQSGLKRVGSKAGAVSGVSGAREYLKQRKAYREDLKATKIQGHAGKIATGLGIAKEKAIGSVGTGINDIWRKGFGGKKADDLRTQVGKDKETLSNIQNGDGPGYDKAKEKIGNTMRNINAGKSKKFGEDTFIKESENIWKKLDKDGKVSTLSKENMESEMLDVEENRLEASIKSDNTKADKLAAKQKRWDRAARMGLVAGGGMTVLASGGLLGVGVGAGMIGAAASRKGSIKDAGDVDNKLASNYRVNRINKEMEDKKQDSKEKLFATADDKTINALERAAAAMELMSRKELSAEQVHDYRTELQDKLGGAREENGIKYWKDKKLNSRFEMAASNIPGASLLYKKGKEGDEQAQFEIEQNYANNRISMKDMSATTLKETIGQLAKGMKDTRFKNDFKDLSDSMQKSIIKALEKHGSYEAKAKLAWVADIEKAFDVGAAKVGTDKAKFLGKLNEEKMNDILVKGTDIQRRKVIEAVDSNAKVLSSGIMQNQSARAKAIRKTLGVETKEEK